MAPRTTRKRKSPTLDNDVDQGLARPKKQANAETVSKFFASDLNTDYAVRKARLSIPEAKKGIRNRANEVLALVAELEKGERETEDGKSLANALSDITRATSSRESGEHIYDKARACITEFQRAVGQYEAFSKDSHGIEKPEGMRWAQDGQDLVELDSKAMAVSLRMVNGSVLGRKGGREFAPPVGGRDDLEMMAWEMLAEGRPDDVKDTWGAAMQDMMAAVRDVVRLFPSGM